MGREVYACAWLNKQANKQFYPVSTYLYILCWYLSKEREPKQLSQNVNHGIIYERNMGVQWN